MLRCIDCTLKAFYCFVSISFCHFAFADMYGYNSAGKSTFLKITVAVPKLIATTKRLLSAGFKTPNYPDWDYQAFESFIDFEIRFVIFILL